MSIDSDSDTSTGISNDGVSNDGDDDDNDGDEHDDDDKQIVTVTVGCRRAGRRGALGRQGAPPINKHSAPARVLGQERLQVMLTADCNHCNYDLRL